MTNYTKSTDFAVKDVLLTGNPNKLVKGSEVDVEFSNMELADATNVKKTGSTGSAVMPVGTTAQRDASPAVGYTRVNTTSGTLEWWDGTIWTSANGGDAYDLEVTTATAGQTVITTASSFVVGSHTLMVYLNGLLVNKTSDYTETTTNSFTFNSGLTAGDEVVAQIWRTNIATSGDALTVSYTPAGTGAVATTVQEQLRKTVFVTDFGSVALTALNSAGAVLATGGTLSLPKGTYTLSDKFTFAGQRLNMVGDGRNVSTISFSPASSNTAIEYNNPAAGGLYQGSIKGLGFSSGNSVDKTAIVLQNTADCELSDIGISSGAWLGTGSIGIRTYGRQTLTVRNCQIACARPIVFSQNPSYTSINTDHYTVEHCELTTTLSTGSSIEFGDGVMHTNTTLRELALTGGKNGILWNDTTSVGASYALNIENIRTEQGADPTGWSIDLQTTGQSLQNVAIKNAYLDPNRNGIRLRNAKLVTLENVYFSQTSGTQLDITLVSGTRLVLINCFFQTGGTKTITNGRCVRRSQDSTQGHTIEEWVYDAFSYSGAEYSDTYHHGAAVTVANGATLLLGASATSTGFVFISTSEDVSAIFLLAGPTATTREVTDPLGFFSATKGTATSYNVYYELGNYYLENNRGASATVSVFKMLTTA